MIISDLFLNCSVSNSFFFLLFFLCYIKLSLTLLGPSAGKGGFNLLTREHLVTEQRCRTLWQRAQQGAVTGSPLDLECFCSYPAVSNGRLVSPQNTQLFLLFSLVQHTHAASDALYCYCTRNQAGTALNYKENSTQRWLSSLNDTHSYNVCF